MFAKFMSGRYGFDNYSLMLLLLSLMLFGTRYLWVFGIAAAAYAIFRMLSKNTGKRREELNGFIRVFSAYLGFIRTIFGRVAQFFSLQKRRLGERKTAVFIKCPNCRKTLRLPRHKGMLEVSCPVCSGSFRKKT
jgi:hypothetical protein